MTVFQFIIAHWFELTMGIIILVALGVSIYKFSKLPAADRHKKIRAWMLYAVIEAEKEWGGGTGKAKLAKVYSMFIAKFPIVSIVLSLDTFNALVEDTLVEMRKLLENNDKLAAVVISTTAP